jgi:AcrR family transcriptional regulator
VATRRYEQRLRAAAAEATRARILEAAVARLREAPSRPLSVDRVARDAGVARSTIYVVFGSRAGLFDALGAELHHRGGFDRVLEAIAHPDALEHLRGGIAGGVHVFAADRDVFRALTSMAALDADAVGGAMTRLDETRSRGMAHLAGRLAEQDKLRPELSTADAANVLFVMTSFDAFDLLFTGRGLPAAEVARLLADAAERAVCR